MNVSLLPRFLIATLAILLAVLPLRFSFSHPKDQPDGNAKNLDDACAKLKDFENFTTNPNPRACRMPSFSLATCINSGMSTGRTKTVSPLTTRWRKSAVFGWDCKENLPITGNSRRSASCPTTGTTIPVITANGDTKPSEALNLTFDAGSFGRSPRSMLWRSDTAEDRLGWRTNGNAPPT